jgi:uncharacterized protein
MTPSRARFASVTPADSSASRVGPGHLLRVAAVARGHALANPPRRGWGWVLALGLLCACRNGTAQPDSPTGEGAVEVSTPDPVEPAGVEGAAQSPSEEEPTLAQAAMVETDAVEEAEPDAAVALDSSTEKSPEEPANLEPRTVLILGDSLAATGFGALLERRLGAHPSIKAHRKGKSASGLARPDFFDWFREGKRQVELRNPDLVIVIMGGNDGQDLTRRKKGDKRVSWKDEAWSEAYRERMDAFLETIAAPDRTVLWLGLPTMGLKSFERKLELIRAIQKEAVEASGGIYLDTTPFVSTEDGEMLTHAQVGGKGKPRELRADDRIHFTMSGSEYFAERVYPEVLRVLGMPDDPAG